MLWFELLPLARAAHGAGDDDLLGRIYGYARWCHAQGGELTNAVGVSFYEHLLAGAGNVRVADVLSRLDDRVVADVWGPWEWREPEANVAAARRILRGQRRP